MRGVAREDFEEYMIYSPICRTGSRSLSMFQSSPLSSFCILPGTAVKQTETTSSLYQ